MAFLRYRINATPTIPTANEVLTQGLTSLQIDANFRSLDYAKVERVGEETITGSLTVDNIKLDANTISSADTNGNITIFPNGTGDVQLDTDTVRIGEASAPVTLTTNTTTPLTITTGAVAASAAGNSITIQAGTGGATSGAGGALDIKAGSAAAGTSTGGALTLEGGASFGANVTGSTTTIKAGNGTGTGGSGAINFQVAAVGSTGSTANTFATRLSIANTGVVSANASVGSTSDTTGTLVVTGGTGISENLYVGGLIQVDNLRLQDNTLSSTNTDGNIVLAPNGTGDVQLDADTVRVGDSNAAATVTTNGTGSLTIRTGSTNSGSVLINQGDNGNIEVSPHNTGTVILGSTTANTNVKGSLDVDGDVNIDGGDLTVSTATFNLANTNATTGNLFGVSTAVNVGTSAAAASTLTFGPTISGNTFEINSTGAGTITLSSDVTTGTVNLYTGTTTGTVNLGSANAGKLVVAFTTDTTSNSTGALQVAGGVMVAKDLFVGGQDIITDQTGTFNVLNTNTTTVNFAGAATVINAGTTKTSTISSVSRFSNEATITTNTAHGLAAGDIVNIECSNSGFSGSFVTLIAGTASTTIKYANVGADLVNTPATGSVIFGITTIRNNLDVDEDALISKDLIVGSDVEIRGGDLTTNQTTFNLLNNTATTVNFAGAATTIEIGATTGTTNINNSLDVDGNISVDLDLNINGGDLTVSTATFNLVNTTATTVNFAGAATSIEIGSSSGTTNINHNLDVDGDVNIDGGDLTVSTATFNLANTNATTVNAFGAATSIEIGSSSGTTNINHNLDVDGDVNIDGGDLTVSTTTFNLANTTATTGNLFGASTAVNVGVSAASASTLTFGPTITNNTFEINSTAAGTINLTSDVTTGIVNLYTGTTTGTVNLGSNAAGKFVVAFNTDTTSSSTGALQVAGGVAVAKDLFVGGGDIITDQTSFNLLNANATTVNFAGAATTIEIGSSTGTTNINHNLDVDGDVNIDGGDLTVSTATFNLANTNATTGNLFGAATAVNVGVNATAASTLTFGPAITNNTFEINSTAAGTINLTSDVTTGVVNLYTGTTTGTVNLGSNAAGKLVVAFNTDTTSNSTGALQVAGGVMVAKDLFVGGQDIITDQTTFNVIDTSATTINAFGAATTFALGYDGTASNSTTNINTGANASGVTKAINIGTSGVSGSTTNITLGSNVSGNTTAITLNGSTTIQNNLNVNGNTTLGDADSDTITATASMANGTAWRTTTTAAHNYHLSAYDTNDSTYRNLVTLTAGGAPSISIGGISGAISYITATTLQRSGEVSSGAWTTTSPIASFNSATFTDTTTAASTLVSGIRAAISMNTPTFASTNANVTLANAATLYVENPAAGTNTTISNRYAIYNAGNQYIAGSLTVLGDTVFLSQSVSLNGKQVVLGNLVAETGINATSISGAANPSTGVFTATLNGVDKLLAVGQILTKTSGTGAFGTNTRVTGVSGSIGAYTVTVQADTAFTNSSGAIVFSSSTATDYSADGGGLVLKGTTDKSILWIDSTDSWTFNQNISTSGRVKTGNFIQDGTLTGTLSSTSQTAVDTTPTTTSKSIKYIIEATQGSNYQYSEVMTVNNGTNAFLVEYANVYTSANPLVSYDADINGGNVRLLATAATATTTLKILKIYAV